MPRQAITTGKIFDIRLLLQLEASSSQGYVLGSSKTRVALKMTNRTSVGFYSDKYQASNTGLVEETRGGTPIHRPLVSVSWGFMQV